MPDDLRSRLAEFMGQPPGGEPDPNETLNLSGRLRDFMDPLRTEMLKHQDAVDKQYTEDPRSAPPETRPHYYLEQAYQREREDAARDKSRSDPATHYVAGAMGFISPLLKRKRKDKYEAAVDRYKADEYSDDYQGHLARERDAGQIARYEMDQNLAGQFQREHPIASAASSAQALVSESLAGGALLSKVAPTVSVGTALVPNLAKGGVQLAAHTAVTPELYLNGRSESDATNFTYGMIQNAILGKLQTPANAAATAIPTAAGRTLARAGVGAALFPAEQQAADVVTSVADEFLPDAYQFKTKYGTLGEVLRKEEGAKRDAAMQSLTGALFAAVHAGPNLKERKAAFDAEMTRYRDFMDTRKGQGMAEEAASKSWLSQPVAAPERAPSGPTPAEPAITPPEGETSPAQSQESGPAAPEQPPVKIGNSATPDVAAPVTSPVTNPAEIPGKMTGSVAETVTNPVTNPATADAIRDLYSRAGDTSIPMPDVEQTLGKMGDLSKKELVALADSLEIKGQNLKSKAAIQATISQRVLDKRSAVQRASMIEGEPAKPSMIDKLRAKKQDAEATPPPERKGLQSLFPEPGPETTGKLDDLEDYMRSPQRGRGRPPGEGAPDPSRLEALQAKGTQTSPEELGKGGDRAGLLRLPDLSGAGEKVTEWAGRQVDTGRELAGVMYPRTQRLAPEAADAMARSTSAARYGEKLGERIVEKVKEAAPDLLPGEENFYGKVYQQWRHETAEQQLRAEAQAQRAAGKTKAADRLEKKANQIVSFIGPDFTRGEYQQGLADPKFKAIIGAWKKEGVPVIETELRKATGRAPGAAIPSLTQIPGLPISVIATAHDTPGAVRTTRRGELTNPRQRPAGAAREASLSADAYNTNLWEMMRQSVSKRTGPAAQREAYRIMQDSQLANRGAPGQKLDGWKEFKDVFPNKKGRADSLYVRDEAADEVRKWFDVDKPSPKVAAQVFTMASLASSQEAFTHSKNIGRGVFEPGWSPVDFASNFASRLLQTGYAKDRIIELERIAAQKPEGLVTPTISKSPLNPMTWTRKVLDVFNDVQRMTLDDAYTRLVTQGRKVDSESGRRDFINTALGQYERRAQHDLVRLARDTGFGPFATAGATGWFANMRALTGASGGQATSAKAELGLRAEKFARLLALPAAAALYNYLKWGRADGDDSVPFGAMKTGEDKNGKSEYVEMLRLTPLGGAARQTGVSGAAEVLRHEGTPGQAFDRAAGDVISAGSHPFLGPATEFAHTAVTGRDHFGRMVATQPGPEGTQQGENLRAAALGANPMLKALEPEIRRGLGMPERPEAKGKGERAAALLGDFRLKYSKGEAAQHLSDVYELKRRYLASTGRADESAPQTSAIAGLRDAALADDEKRFKEAWQAYIDRAKAAGKSGERFNQDLRASLDHLDPLKSLSDQDKKRFYQSLDDKQKEKVKAARAYSAGVRKKIAAMIQAAK